MRLPRTVLASLLLLTAFVFAAPKKDSTLYFEQLPATNPYREVLLRLDALPATDREILKNWVRGYTEDEPPPPAPSGEQLALARELTAGLVTAAARSELEPVSPGTDLWPIYYPNGDDENPFSAIFPGLGPLRELAQLSTKVAADSPASEAIEIYTAAARLGRERRSGTTLIEQLTGIAIEGIAQSGVASRLRDFSAEELEDISLHWANLPAPPDNIAAMRGERDLFFIPLLKKHLLPGMEELLAAEVSGIPPPEPAAEGDYTRDLRLSGLVDLGDGELRVSLENTRTRETITLTPTAPAEGIELGAVDFAARTAILRRNGVEAVVNLESKKIRLRGAAARELKAVFTQWFGEEEGKGMLARILSEARSDPDGAAGYFRRITAHYDALLVAQVASAEDPVARPRPDLVNDDPILANLMPTFSQVARTMQSIGTQNVMLQAAIARRLGELRPDAPAETISDPWTDDASPFTFSPTEDGGFTLRSVYQVRENQPIVYKFAAPDAGFQRVIVPPPESATP